MKAITLTQPWATLVAIGAKRWETRSWSTRYRGPLAIHAAKSMPGYAKDAYFEAPFHDALCPVANGEGYNLQDLPRGEVIAIVNLLGCWPAEALIVSDKLTEQERAFGDYGPNRYGWRLASPAPIKPGEKAVGHLGLWDWEPSLIVREWLLAHYPPELMA